MDVTTTAPLKRNLSAVITLFFVAPLVAEFLLGDLPLKLLPVLIMLAPMYGGGAVLIRETVRRTGRGWPSILLLGAAYGLIEEAYATQSLFNPDYLKMHAHWLAVGYIPALGIGSWWTLLTLNVHAFWSMGVSIALVEALVPEAAESPWLGRVGDTIVAVVFVLGVAANAEFQMKKDPFRASHAQFLSIAAVCLVLIVAAFLLPLRGARTKTGFVPNPWLTGVLALFLGLVVNLTSPHLGWEAVWIMLSLDAIFLSLVGLFSQRTGWRPVHTFSLGAGGAIAYGLHAFIQPPLVPGSVLMARIGNAIFLAAAIAVIVVGAKQSSRLTVSPAEGTLNT
jgi:hypothetical protein